MPGRKEKSSEQGRSGHSSSSGRGKKTTPTIEGVLHMHPDGFGFVHPSSGEGENIFIPPDQAQRALAGDKVRVEVVPGKGGRTMGRLVELSERTRTMVVGTYEETRHGAHVETDIGHVLVPKTQLARPGDAVKVRLGIGQSLLGAGTELTGEVAGSLGKPGDESVEVLSIAYSQGFNEEFPAEVMDEADRFPTVVSEEDASASGRRDLRSMQLVTIDGSDARDFDDAIFCEPHRDGFRLVVAIADVAHYVKEGSALDKEALRRATSVYLPGRVLPMLPERLSNGLCSLKPDEVRLCLVADMIIDRAGATIKTEIYPGAMRSAARCTYEEVHAVLHGEHVAHRIAFKPLFDRLFGLSKILRGMRQQRGAIDFDLPETRVELDEEGHAKGMVRRDRLESHRIVEECMLAANEAVARWFREKEVPTVNRYHAPPDEEKLAAFTTVARALGVEVKTGAMSSKELNALLQSLTGHKEQRALNQLMLRSMMQATYSSFNTGHYGLGATDYLHFTSPIRRYPDTLVHRMLHRLWSAGGELPKRELERLQEQLEEMSVQSSERERAAMKVEREVVSFYAALLMKDRIGEEHQGTVSGLTESGFFVELDVLFIDGMVRPTGGGWRFDQQRYLGVLGSGQVVKVGAKVTVRVESVNLQRRQIDYSLVAGADDDIEEREDFDAMPRSSGRSSRGGGAAAQAGNPRDQKSRYGKSAPQGKGQRSGGFSARKNADPPRAERFKPAAEPTRPPSKRSSVPERSRDDRISTVRGDRDDRISTVRGDRDDRGGRPSRSDAFRPAEQTVRGDRGGSDAPFIPDAAPSGPPPGFMKLLEARRSSGASAPRPSRNQSSRPGKSSGGQKTSGGGKSGGGGGKRGGSGRGGKSGGGSKSRRR